MNRSQHFYGLVFLLIAVRFFHLGKQIDQPHDWRQCDTAYYIQDFYENGIDLLYPAVCWMGNSDTLALEFPLPEAVVAVGYNLFGESIPLARICFLVFFLGAVYYLYKIVRLLSNVSMARIATLVYLSLPLSFFYSRAVHIDFSVIFLAHAMVYYFFRGIDNRNGWYVLLSGAITTLAFLIKIPYAFYWFLPMSMYVIERKAFRWVLP
uniref:ArnT family glycosyltransferase n=1 Tax=Algoriphagus sp. TaxID=1872435 RepID=UPI0025CE9B3E